MEQSQNVSPTHRCFYAVKFSDEITTYLARLIAEFRGHNADVRWVPRENLHLTLRFLGELNDEQFIAARELLRNGPAFDPFEIGAYGLGAFPSLRNASVLWAGVRGKAPHDTKALLHIQEQTESWARQLGLPAERRRYSPHITLGRVRRAGSGLRELVNDITTRECDAGFCRVGELLLMRSALSQGGAAYEVVASAGCRHQF